MNRTQFNKSVVPGLFSFAVSSYRPKSGEEMWRQLVDAVRPSRRAYEESAYYGALGLIPVKAEGVGVAYSDMSQGPTKRWTHITYGLGVRITEELIDDTLYGEIPTEMESISRELGSSSRETIEVLTWDLINSGTATTSHTAGDALAIFSASHTLLNGGIWNNLLSPAADLSATSLQAALDDFETTVDDTGKIQAIRANKIFTAPANAWKAKELLQSAYDPESANNSINAIKERNLQHIVSPYLTDTDAFTLKADPPSANDGLICFMRRKPTFARDGDFGTGDALFKVTFRHSVEYNKPSNIYLSAGA